MAKVKESGSVALDAPATMKPEIVVFTVVGISPLLQNNPTEFIGKDDDTTLVAGKKKYNDENEAAMRVYRDADGAIVHPSVAFVRAMVKAVSGKKFGKLKAPDAIKGAVFITEPFTPVEMPDGKPMEKYAIDKQPVIVGRARVPRCRPRYDQWRMRVALEIDTSILTAELVKQALSLAGRIKGVGDYRPEKGGGFGRFRVE